MAYIVYKHALAPQKSLSEVVARQNRKEMGTILFLCCPSCGFPPLRKPEYKNPEIGSGPKVYVTAPFVNPVLHY